MQETLTFPTLGSPPRFTFPELPYVEHNSAYCSELSSSTSTPFASAPSSPTRSKGFYFSAPTSPSWAQRTLLSQEKQGFYWPLNPSHHGRSDEASLHMQDSSCEGSTFWSQQTAQLQRSGYAAGGRVSSLQTEHHESSVQAQYHGGSTCFYKTEHHGRSCGSHTSLQEGHTNASNWALQSLQRQAEHNSSPSYSQKSLQTTHHQRNTTWAPQSLHTESFLSSQKAYQAEHERSPNRAQHTSPQHSSSRSLNTLHTEHARSPPWSKASLEIKHLHAQSIITDFANHKAPKQLQLQDNDSSYCRQGFYASAVPFSWEEKPGTPKARSVTSEASYGDDDSPSNLLSGSSEFEFSARFSEFDDPPMSPTPISSTWHSFKHQYAYGSPSPRYEHAYANPHMQSEVANDEKIWPLRPPPRLNNPVLPMKQLMKDEVNQLRCSNGSLASLSAPQSPRSPRKFDIRGVLCGISSPVDAVFDPFLVAMEKTMAKSGDDLSNEEMRKSPKKSISRQSHGHHRRSQSLSPLRVFHWDDHSANSNSSSNGSSSMDEVKNKHPIQREINARHSAGASKGSKRWSFKGFLHRKTASSGNGSGGGGESTRHSSRSGSLRSSGRESCSSSGSKGEMPMDASYADDNVKVRGGNTPSVPASMPSTPAPILSPSSSNSSRGKLGTLMKANKGPYAFHYGTQRAHTEDLNKKTFLPYRQGLLGCLGLSSKSYRALATLSKPLQSVS